MRPHRRQPTRLPRPWDSPGTNTGVGCHFLLQCIKVKSESEVAQSCPTLSNPMDCSLPGSSVHGIFQARVLERVPLPSNTHARMCAHTHTHARTCTHTHTHTHTVYHLLLVSYLRTASFFSFHLTLLMLENKTCAFSIFLEARDKLLWPMRCKWKCFRGGFLASFFFSGESENPHFQIFLLLKATPRTKTTVL